jgi:pimeloyl-[acyl-carrier protein] methyl ester esterase
MTSLVFLHGWGFGSRVWSAVADRLGGTWDVHLADLPGYGQRVMEADDLPPGSVLCAWSLGALRALRWAVERPDRISRLVLVGATPRFLQAPDWPDAQPPELLAGFAAGLADDPARTLRRFAALVNQGDSQARAATRALTALLDAGMPSASALAAGLDELRDTDLRGDLAAIGQPVLVVHGRHDPLMPLAAGRSLAEQLPNARLAIMNDAAHGPFLSRPEPFAGLLAEFLHD